MAYNSRQTQAFYNIVRSQLIKRDKLDHPDDRSHDNDPEYWNKFAKEETDSLIQSSIGYFDFFKLEFSKGYNELIDKRTHEKYTIYDDGAITGPEQWEGDSGWCYVATCVYGSYDCPQVWTLRRFRDNTLAVNPFGRAFIKTYYAISPTVVNWFGKYPWFHRLFKKPLDKWVEKLNENGVDNTPYTD